jgi:dienelactone hydrolase
MTRTHEGLVSSRKAHNSYGSLEQAMRGLRNHRPLDLTAERWRQANPAGDFVQWQLDARQCLRQGLHYDPPPCDLAAETTGRLERDDYTLEFVEFNTTPWFRVEGCFLLPKDAPGPLPALVVFHAWGGPMIFGKERIVDTGRDHPLLAEHRRVYSGRYLAEELCRQGYAVLVIDAFHFGRRAPRGIGDIPARYEAMDLSIAQAVGINNLTSQQLYLGVRQLNWAGTTWAGVNFHDDSRCVDYLQSRPEVDPDRIGCTGLSGGGYRTDMMVALEPRIKAAVSVGWMTVGDYQQVYNFAGCVGTFCLLPGVWDRLDVPDMIAMGAPCAAMVVSGSEDMLFPPEGQEEARRQIAGAYQWAGVGERFHNFAPSKPHCYDADIQAEAIRWLDRWLKT